MPADEFDAFTRHQLYVEGYKNGQSDTGDDVLKDIGALIALALIKTGYDKISDMPKRVLNKFINRILKQVRQKLNTFVKANRLRLKSFMSADLSVQKFLFKQLGGKTYSAPKASKLFAQIENAPVAGVGIELKEMYKAFINSTLSNISKTIKIGVADQAPIKSITENIIGTASNKFKDGLINKLGNQLSTVIQTSIQHITSLLLFTVGSAVTEKYQWISVLDGKTTDICLSRSGNIYYYANGPRPPAHYNCRSTIVPVIVKARKKVPTYHAWLKQQPRGIQDDAIGPTRGKSFRKGDIKENDLPSFDGTKPLTLEQYKAKRSKLIG